MGFYSELQIEMLELAEDGFTAAQITKQINDKYRPILEDGLALVTLEQVEDFLVEYSEEVRYG